MLIRESTPDDADRMVEYVTERVTLSPHASRRGIDRTLTRRQAFYLTQRPDVICVLAEEGERLVGLFAGVLHNELLSGQSMLSQVCLYLDPEQRKRFSRRFLDGIEGAAARRHAMLVVMAPEERYRRMYRRRGYETMDVTMGKAV